MDEGYAIFLGTAPNAPIDDLAGPCSMAVFVKDMYRIPDKVEAALEVVCEHRVNLIRHELSGPVKPFSTFIGNARSLTDFILGAGCSIPYNSKLENVKAMVAAATGK